MIRSQTNNYRPYLLRLFVIVLVLFCISTICSCGTTGWKHGYERSKYTSLGWLKVTEYDNSAEYTGYNRLQNEMAFDPSIEGFVNNHGMPDYLWVPNRGQLYLAYLQEGKIYKFIGISAYGSGEPLNIKYTDDNSLPIFLAEEFKNKDIALAKPDSSAEIKSADNTAVKFAEAPQQVAFKKGMFDTVWEYYIHLKEYKSLAIAFDDSHNWCGSIVHGIGRTKDYTENTALFWCREKAAKYNIRSECKVYALNNDKVGSLPGANFHNIDVSITDARWAKNDPSLTTPQYISHNEAIRIYELGSANRALFVATKNEHVAVQTNYIYGISSNQKDISTAIDKAKDECNRHRETYNIVSPCYLVSVNNNYFYSKDNPKLALTTKTPDASPKSSEQPSQRIDEPTIPPKSSSPDYKQYTSTGTGFAVRNDGTILTAYHVVKDAISIDVELHDGSIHVATIVKFSRNNDLAVLKIKNPTPYFLELGESNDIRTGEHVFTLGYPVIEILGKEPKYTDGTISSLSGIADEAALMQISVPIQPGNSGGPLVNDKGRVVGVVTSTAAVSAFLKITGTLPQNVNWAINADYARPLFNRPVSKKEKVLEKSEIVERTKKSVCLVMINKKEVEKVAKEEIGQKESEKEKSNADWRYLGSNPNGNYYYDINSVKNNTSTKFSVWTRHEIQGESKIKGMNYLKKYTKEYESLKYIMAYFEVDVERRMHRYLVITYTDIHYRPLHSEESAGKWAYIPSNSIIDKMAKEINSKR